MKRGMYGCDSAQTSQPADTWRFRTMPCDIKFQPVFIGDQIMHRFQFSLIVLGSIAALTGCVTDSDYEGGRSHERSRTYESRPYNDGRSYESSRPYEGSGRYNDSGQSYETT